MLIEVKITGETVEEVQAAVSGLADRLAVGVNGTEETAPKSVDEKPKRRGRPKKAEAEKREPAEKTDETEVEEVPTIDDVRTVMSELMNALPDEQGQEAVVGLLGELGVAKASDLDEKQRIEYVRKANAMIAEAS